MSANLSEVLGTVAGCSSAEGAFAGWLLLGGFWRLLEAFGGFCWVLLGGGFWWVLLGVSFCFGKGFQLQLQEPRPPRRVPTDALLPGLDDKTAPFF